MMTFKEKVQSDLEVYKRVLEKLKEYDCEDKAIAIVSGMIVSAYRNGFKQGCKFTTIERYKDGIISLRS